MLDPNDVFPEIPLMKVLKYQWFLLFITTSCDQKLTHSMTDLLKLADVNNFREMIISRICLKDKFKHNM